MGRVGRAATARAGQLRFGSTALLWLVRRRAGDGPRCRGWSAVSAGPPSGPPRPRHSAGSLDHARYRRRAVLALVAAAAALLPVPDAAAARTPGGAGAVPPAHAADLESGGTSRTAGLGRERGGESLQCAGRRAGP